MGNELQDEINQMNKPFVMGGDEVKTDPPVTDAPDVKTEPPTTDEPNIDGEDGNDLDIKTDPPATDAPTTGAPDDKDQTILDLRAKLAERDIKTDPPTTKAPIVFEDQDFVKDIDLEETIRDPKEFNKILNSIYQKAVTDTQQKLGNQMSQSIPNMITVASNLQKATEIFYDSNEDLKPFKKVVATVFGDLVKTNPDKPYAEVMQDVAPEVRKRLELPDYVKKTVDKNTPPKLPKKKSKPGRTNAKPDLDPLQEDIGKMNETLRR